MATAADAPAAGAQSSPAAVKAGMTPHEFLETLAVVLCVAAVTTVLFQKLRQPVVLGYLLAGAIVGPNIPVPVVASTDVVHALSELGVILLMFGLGLEFSLGKLMRVGGTAGIIAVIQCSLMIWLGYFAGQLFGWTTLESFYAGSIIAISSTTIIVKAFEEQRIREKFTETVFGVLIFEDLIGILLLTILTTLSTGKDLTVAELSIVAGRLLLFLLVLIGVGLLIVPRLVRAVVRLQRAETIVVSTVGIAFGTALLALAFGYSVALGAFIGGMLVAESGAVHTIERLVQPVRDIFGAIFFVSVGMLIDPAVIVEYWLPVLAFLLLVVVGKIIGVGFGAFLTGQGITNSVKTSMSLAQIGEFSFIIAALGLSTGATREFLYPIAVAVSAITTLLTPGLIRASDAAAAYVDRKLPRSLQTYAALYGSWLEQLRTTAGQPVSRTRRLIRWLLVDAIILTAAIVGVSIEMLRLTTAVETATGMQPGASQWVVIGLAALVTSPFWIGLLGTARALGLELGARALPMPDGKLDLAAAPRRALVVTLQVGIVVLVGAPLLAITQPFVAPLPGLLILIAVLAFLSIGFWRSATNLQGHTRAAAQAIVEGLARQTRAGRVEGEELTQTDLGEVFSGLGKPQTVELPEDSPIVGRTLTEVNLRGRTGATILSIRRSEGTVVLPNGREVLRAGDVLVLTGTDEAIVLAKKRLADSKTAEAR
jgi:CPA2 family monovalent cation:H+ antiporter-2